MVPLRKRAVYLGIMALAKLRLRLATEIRFHWPSACPWMSVNRTLPLILRGQARVTIRAIPVDDVRFEFPLFIIRDVKRVQYKDGKKMNRCMRTSTHLKTTLSWFLGIH